MDRGHRDVVRLRVTDPDGGRQVGLVAIEPGVGEVVCGAGLSCLPRAAGVGGCAGSAGDVHVEDLGDLVGDGLGQHSLGVRLVRMVDLLVREDDFADGDRVAVDAAGGQGRIRIGHLQRRDTELETTEGLGRVAVELGGDTHLLGRRGDVLGPDVECHLGIYGVVRGQGRLGHAHRARIGIAIGGDVPVAIGRIVDAERLRHVVGRVRVHALLDRRGQGEGLEGRSRLAPALGGEVVLAVEVGRGGHHRLDLAGLGVDRDQGR